MSYEQRARKARARGDAVRAAVLLIEGLKRRGGQDQAALELLCAIYVEDLTSSGLEKDLVRAILAGEHPRSRLEAVISGLKAADKISMGRELIRIASAQGIELAWPPDPPPPVLEPVEPTSPALMRTEGEAETEADGTVESSGETDPAGIASDADAESKLDDAPDGESEHDLDHQSGAEPSDKISATAKSADPVPNPGSSSESSAHSTHLLHQSRAESAGEIDDFEPGDRASTFREPDESNLHTQGAGRPDIAGPRTTSSAEYKRRPRRRWPGGRPALLSVTLIAVLALIIWLIWGRGISPAGLSRLDAQIEQSDPAVSGSVEEVFKSSPTSSLGKSNAPVAERQDFMRAVAAAEWGEKSASVSSTGNAWGLGAEATSAALQGELARALSSATRLEREYPDTLPAMWAAGFVEEARGRFAQALQAYLDGARAYPEFTPFLSAQFRISVRQGQLESARKIQAKLAKSSPKNPYAELTIRAPELNDLQKKSVRLADISTHSYDPKRVVRADSSLVERPKFARALLELNAALKAMDEGDWSNARAQVERSLERDPQLAPALLLAGVLRAADLNPEAADQAWARLAETPGLASDYRWLLQIAGPLSLARAGRPDLAMQYITQVRGLGQLDRREIPDFFNRLYGDTKYSENLYGMLGSGDKKTKKSENTDNLTDKSSGIDKNNKDSNPLDPQEDPNSPLPAPRVPILSVEEKLQSEPLARQAVLARAEVLSLIGLGRAAQETLELLDGVDDIAAERGVLRARVAIRRGQRREALLATRALQAYPAFSAGAAAEIAFQMGDYERASEEAKKASAEAATMDTLRAHTLALAALGRGRGAWALLQESKVSALQIGALRALSMRLAARLHIAVLMDSKEQSAGKKTSPADSSGEQKDAPLDDYSAFLALRPTSVDLLVDLAHAAFWRQDFPRARDLGSAALQIAPEHPAAHWIMGLVDQILSDPGAAPDPANSASAEAQSGHFDTDHFKHAWRDDPRDPLLLVEMGEVYLSLEKPRRAQQAFYWAFLRDRGNLAAIDGLGQAYLDGNRDRGVRDLTRILQGYGAGNAQIAQQVKLLKWLAILEGSREGKQAGRAHLERAVAKVGESAELLVELAHFEQAAGQTDAARKLYARALEKDATLASARLGLARMALKAGDTKAATSQLRRYLQISPPGPEAQWAQETLDTLSDATPEKAQ